MSTDIHELWPENSEGAVVRRKSFVQLGHFPADSWQPFDQVHLKPHFGQVQGSLHACNASAYDKHIPIHERDLL
jgi:hypothetical protein